MDRTAARLRAGYEKIRKHTEQVGDKMIKHALNNDSANLMKDKLHSRRQYAIAGRVLIEECPIGEGGFAFVWKVQDTNTHEVFALKKIICQDKQQLAMAKREVEILARLPEHPNLVRYYGHAINTTDSGRAKEVCLLFEFCPGGHLLDLLDKYQGKLSEERILSVFSEIIRAVALLHSQAPPIQHRDLKVENILLGPNSNFKLCDFGSWCDVRSDVGSLDQKGIGALQEQIDRYTTMMYRPPEMVDFYQQYPISEKVDVWMLGCILFTLMFCRHPFQDEPALAIANAKYSLGDTPVYSQKLQDLVHWLLARDPSNRPDSLQLLDIVEHFSDGTSLPLPAAVQERREKDHRLYDNKDRATKRIDVLWDAGSEKKSEKHEKSAEKAERADRVERPEKSERHRHHKSKKESRSHRSDSGNAEDLWGKVMSPVAGDPWPCAAVPAVSSDAPSPSLGWADFGATGWPQAHTPEPSSPSRGAEGTHSDVMLGCSGGGGSTGSGAIVPDWSTGWSDVTAPSSGSRARPPTMPSPAPSTPSSHARPLALSGGSHRSAGSGASRQTGGSTGGTPTGQGRRRDHERRHAGQDSGGDCWPAAPADGDWGQPDPFAAPQWPDPGPGVATGGWSGFGPMDKPMLGTRPPGAPSPQAACGRESASPMFGEDGLAGGLVQEAFVSANSHASAPAFASQGSQASGACCDTWNPWEADSNTGAQGIWAVLDGSARVPSAAPSPCLPRAITSPCTGVPSAASTPCNLPRAQTSPCDGTIDSSSSSMPSVSPQSLGTTPVARLFHAEADRATTMSPAAVAAGRPQQDVIFFSGGQWPAEASPSTSPTTGQASFAARGPWDATW